MAGTDHGLAELARGGIVSSSDVYDRAVARERIPCSADEPRLTASRLEFRQPWIDLEEAVDAFNASQPPARALAVYADTVHIPRSLIFRGSLLRVVARRIQGGSGAGIVLDHRQSDRTRLQLVCQEAEDGLHVGSVIARDRRTGQQRDQKAMAPQPGSLGMEVSRGPDGIELQRLESLPEAWLMEGGPLARSLMTAFHLAAALESSERELAGSMLTWIAAVCAGSGRQRELGGQSAALLLRLRRRQTGEPPFVPSLQPQRYQPEAKAYGAAAAAYHNAYLRLFDDSRSLAERQKDEQELLERQDETVEFVQSLVALAEQDLERTRKARVLAEQRVVAQQLALALQRAEYEAAIQKWLRGKIMEGVMQSVQAVMGIAQQIPAIATGSPALVTGFAGSAASVLTTAGELTATGVKWLQENADPRPFADVGDIDLGVILDDDELDWRVAPEQPAAEPAPPASEAPQPAAPTPEEKKRQKAAAAASAGIASAVKDATKLKSAIEGIVSASRSAEAAARTAGRVLAQISDTRELVGNPADPLEGIAVVTGGKDEWQVLGELLEKQLEPALAQQMDGTREYLSELRKMVIYGNSVCECRLAYAEAAGQLARVKLQQKYEQDGRERLKRSMERLRAKGEDARDAMQDMYVRYLGVKRGVYLALDNYVRAYNYWALRQSKLQPSMNLSVPEMAGNLARIERECNQALSSFGPHGPQTLERLVLRIEDPVVLDKLRLLRVASWSLELDHPDFADYDRVRLDSVNVRLLGAQVPEQSTIKLYLLTSGRYQDRRKGRRFDFVGEPRPWLLKHGPNVATGSESPAPFKYAYLQPTPFTDWILIVPLADNPEMDLSGLTGIEMTLTGSFIPRVG